MEDNEIFDNNFKEIDENEDEDRDLEETFEMFPDIDVISLIEDVDEIDIPTEIPVGRKNLQNDGIKDNDENFNDIEESTLLDEIDEIEDEDDEILGEGDEDDDDEEEGEGDIYNMIQNFTHEFIMYFERTKHEQGKTSGLINRNMELQKSLEGLIEKVHYYEKDKEKSRELYEKKLDENEKLLKCLQQQHRIYDSKAKDYDEMKRMYESLVVEEKGNISVKDILMGRNNENVERNWREKFYEVEEERKKLDFENLEWKRKYFEVEGSYKALKEELNLLELKKKGNEDDEDIENLQNNLKYKENYIEKLEANKFKMETEFEKMKKENAVNSKKFELSLKEVRREKEIFKKNVVKEKDNYYSKKLDELNDELTRTKSTNDVLKEKVKKTESHVVNVQSLLNEEKRKVIDLEKENEQVNLSLKESNERVEKMEIGERDFESDKDMLNERLRELEKESEELKTQNRKCLEFIKKQNLRIHNLKTLSNNGNKKVGKSINPPKEEEKKIVDESVNIRKLEVQNLKRRFESDKRKMNGMILRLKNELKKVNLEKENHLKGIKDREKQFTDYKLLVNKKVKKFKSEFQMKSKQSNEIQQKLTSEKKRLREYAKKLKLETAKREKESLQKLRISENKVRIARKKMIQIMELKKKYHILLSKRKEIEKQSSMIRECYRITYLSEKNLKKRLKGMAKNFKKYSRKYNEKTTQITEENKRLNSQNEELLAIAKKKGLTKYIKDTTTSSSSSHSSSKYEKLKKEYYDLKGKNDLLEQDLRALKISHVDLINEKNKISDKLAKEITDLKRRMNERIKRKVEETKVSLKEENERKMSERRKVLENEAEVELNKLKVKAERNFEEDLKKRREEKINYVNKEMEMKILKLGKKNEELKEKIEVLKEIKEHKKQNEVVDRMNEDERLNGEG